MSSDETQAPPVKQPPGEPTHPTAGTPLLPAPPPLLPHSVALSVVAFPLVVVGLFVGVRKLFAVNAFDVSQLAAIERPLRLFAAFDAAKANWASAMFLATVLMAAVALLGCVCTLRATIAPRGKGIVAILTLVVAITVLQSPDLVLLTLQQSEIDVVFRVSDFHAAASLLFFLAGTFSAAFLFACGIACVVHDAFSATTVTAVVAARELVREALALVAAWLVVGVVGLGLFHRMVRTCIQADALESFNLVVQSSSVFSGSFYSALMVAIFLPAELALRSKARAHAAQFAHVDNQSASAWLNQDGFDISIVKSLAQVAAMLAPLFAGVVQGLVNLPGRG